VLSAKTKRRILALGASIAVKLECFPLLSLSLAPTATGSLAGRPYLRRSLSAGPLTTLADVDAALKEGAVFDRNAGRHYVAGERNRRCGCRLDRWRSDCPAPCQHHNLAALMLAATTPLRRQLRDSLKD